MSTSRKIRGHASAIKSQLSLKKSKNSSLTLLSPMTMLRSSKLSSQFNNNSVLFNNMTEEQTVNSCSSVQLNNNRKCRINTNLMSRLTPSFKIFRYHSMMALLTLLLCGLATVNGLKCYMCGQYNEGVGSITPCTNYTDENAHLHLRECSKKSEKYCVKYISQLSTVRDCATECAEKEVWDTQTYCCTDDGCNGSAGIEVTTMVIVGPLIAHLGYAIWNAIKGRR